MNLASKLPWIAVLLSLPVLPAAAEGCASRGQPVTVAAQEEGRGVPAQRQVAEGPRQQRDRAECDLLDCNEELGIVKIRIGGSEQWVDRLALNVRPARLPIAWRARRRAPRISPSRSPRASANRACPPQRE